MTRRRTALLVALALLGASCTGGREPVVEPAIPAENAAAAPLLPRFADALPDADPETFRRLLDQLRGVPVLVNVWGSWCPPCKEEMPRIVEAHADFGKEVQFVGINFWESRDEARAFILRFGMRFPSVFDPPGAIKDSLGYLGQPVTVFYDADGEFYSAWSGPISDDRLRENLRAITG